MKHFLLIYDYVPDFKDKRQPFRGAHLDLARTSAARDELQLGGALADDPPMGVLLFKAESAALVEAFAAADPYVANGVVREWRVREWVTVVGEGALTAL
jgi:hypothetical protein